MDLLLELKKNPFVLAPMAGITDFAFRGLMKELGCQIVISELISATGIKYASKKTIDLLKYDKKESPVGIQLFGENLDDLEYASQYVEQTGVDFIDLNFGCPVNKVVKKGCGSAILKDLKRLSRVLNKVKKSVSIPITIKTRTGWDESSKNSLEVAQIAFDEGITWMALHGRTRSQAYKGLADWDYIKEVKEKSPLPILGNGDIKSPEEAVSKLTLSHCDGVMIGRGCLKNPYIFSQSNELLKNNSYNYNSPLKAFNRLFLSFNKVYNDRVKLIQVRKFALWYCGGYYGAATLRREVFKTEDVNKIHNMVTDFFNNPNLKNTTEAHQAFLMGGDG